jgi:hypothetical protein
MVETFVAVRGGRHRTDRFAGCVVAMLAHHRHEHDLRALARHLHLRGTCSILPMIILLRPSPSSCRNCNSGPNATSASHGCDEPRPCRPPRCCSPLLQAVMQAPQPMQLFRSMLSPQRWPTPSTGCSSQRSNSATGLLVAAVDHTIAVHIFMHHQFVGVIELLRTSPLLNTPNDVSFTML